MGSVRERAVPTLAAVGVSGPASMECARLGSVCVEVFERLGHRSRYVCRLCR